jgi:5-methylcytosine-specific restriction protein A
MGKITKEMYEAAYALAKDIYVNKIINHEIDAKKILHEEYRMKLSSANTYLRNFNQMRKGEKYNRTINNDALEYYLKSILSDFGVYRLKIALKSVNFHMTYIMSLGKPRPKGVQRIYEKYLEILNSNISSNHPDENEITKGTIEGAKKTVIVNKYERSAKEKKRCLEKYEAICSVCNIDFKEEYGDIGEGFIHVHHLKPLHTIKEEYKVDGEKDLRPVCPNCHAMLHKGSPIYSISELKKIIKKAGGRLSERL